MGLLDWLGFGRPKPPPPPPPPVPRRVLVRGLDPDAVARRLGEYDELVPGGRPVTLRVAGPVDGWTVVALPEALHAYWFHNLALWLGDGAGDLLALADGAADPHRYWLGPDPDFSDFLSGYLADGATAVSVYVPDQSVARGHALPLPPADRAATLAGRGVPQALADGPVAALPGAREVTVHLEDLGPGEMNPGLEATLRRREDAINTLDITTL